MGLRRGGRTGALNISEVADYTVSARSLTDVTLPRPLTRSNVKMSISFKWGVSVTVKTSTESIAGFLFHFRNSASPILKSGALALLLAATSGFAVAAVQQSNPCNISEADAAGLIGDFSTQVHAARDYMGAI